LFDAENNRTRNSKLKKHLDETKRKKAKTDFFFLFF